MDNTPINQHLKNMSIMLQMLMFPFQAESVAYWVAQMLGLDTSEYSFGYISGWSKDREVTELKENLDLIKTTADKITSDLERELSKKVDKTETIEAESEEQSQGPRKKVR